MNGEGEMASRQSSIRNDGPRVPRDEAFWNTYSDVEAEFAAAQLRLACLREGHGMTAKYGEEALCPKCGAGVDQILADYEAAGNTVVRNDDGTITMKAGRS